MIIPVGRAVFEQSLVLVEKSAAGEVAMRDVLPVAFVPLVDRGPKASPDDSSPLPRR